MMLAMLNKAVTVNWQGVTRSLYTKNLPSTATDLTDVSELLPGTAIIKCGSTWRTEAFWSPWDHVPSRSVDDYDYHAGRLHDTVVRCVSSLAEPYGSVLVGASGGLDSSIIAAGLVRSNVNLSCLTMTTDDPIGDERGYAHAVCQSLGVQLLASPYSMDDVDLSRSSVAHLPRACGRSEVCAYDAAIYRTLASGEFDAFFSGNGGDNVFFLSRSARALADAWISNGATGGALRTATEISAMTGVSVWKVFREATRFVRSVNRRYRWQPQTKFLHPDIVAQQDADPIRHPWLDAPAGALPGKAAHIALLLRLQPYVACFDRSYGIPTINPLAAQPVIEACLGVPTWLMCRGGHDRSVARAAFSSVLPAEIAWRRSKGGPDGFAIDLLRRSLPVVRERLLTGHLANAGILDLEMLDRSLSDASLSRDWDYPRLLSLLDTDAWIENWTRRPH
jgi:asparagine synthase (glutamine-hydrolysing)